ncbi:hypothetical protein COU37_03680 [Candidatus Micrarchaeota archaeon CG10_big_fil_rev_8_21_14_0_10_45_29]|nr:MAG: hypothetical protein COU37_03680 [Candidatus Micrarchaeota archaeon CG10_big_fil_rev_8_21_14_0_10_45_29]
MKYAISAILVFGMLALAGCISPPAQDSALANTMVDTILGQAKSDVQTAKPAHVEACSISVSSEKTLSGAPMTVYVVASPGEGKTASFLCGDKVQVLGTYGIFSTPQRCVFNQPGNLSVWVAIDGKKCAETNLEVFSLADQLETYSSSCDISDREVSSGPTELRQQGMINYAAQLHYKNFLPSAKLSWNCYGGMVERTLAASFESDAQLLSGAMKIQCAYPADTEPTDGIPVYLDGKLCGKMRN